jgi:hypothetical protein
MRSIERPTTSKSLFSSLMFDFLQLPQTLFVLKIGFTNAFFTASKLQHSVGRRTSFVKMFLLRELCGRPCLIISASNFKKGRFRSRK